MATSLSNTIAAAIQSNYFDDYNEAKQYTKILFRPSVAVQARELNQLQTILQNQVSRLADYTFKDGSIVDNTGMNISYLPKLPFVRLVDTFTANTSKAVTEYDNSFLVTNSANSITAVRAYISYSVRGYQANYPDTNVWYLSYVHTGKDGANNDVNEFQSGDTLYVYNTSQTKSDNLDPAKLLDTIKVITSNATINATGYGYGLTVSGGVIYQKGFFLPVDTQTIIVRNYDQNVNNYVVGFETQETIVTENQDTTLFDNANGSSNYNAPGAHRLKLTPKLTSKLRTEASNTFFAIAEFENSSSITQKANTDPNATLMKTLANRTYDTNGDYVVKPFTVDSQTDTANSSAFYYRISPGIAYVHGYAVEKTSDVYVNSPRAVNTNIDRAIGVTTNFGNYVIVNQYMGIFNSENLGTVNLYDTAQTSMSDRENASSAASGSIIGTANVRGCVYYSGTKGRYDTQFALYLFNIKMNSGKSFSQVKSFVQGAGTDGYARADAVQVNGLTVLTDASTTSTVYDTGYAAVKTLVVNGAASSATSYKFRQISSTTMSSNGSATFNLDTAAPGGNERLSISVGNYSDIYILNQFNVASGAANWSSNVSGTLAITSGNSTVVGTGTSFTTSIANGELVRVSNSSASVLYQVNTVSNNTIMTLVQTPAVTYSGYNFQHYYPEGHVFNATSVNALAGGISFTINTGVNLDNGSMTVYASYPVTKSTATGAKKDVHESTFVKIATSNNAGGTAGPWDLGLVDVFNIKNVYVGTTWANTNPNQANWFYLDSGQRDDMYEHAQLYVKPQYASNITGSTQMLVELDHFTANTTAGVGFFTVDSYPIDDANTANTTAIVTAQIPTFNSAKGFLDLRNNIDFRPTKYNTATVTNSISSASINPSVSNNSFNIGSTVQYMSEPDSPFTADVEYYLPRYDVVTMSTQGNIIAKNGDSAVIPKVPFVENDVMPIAEVYVPPYPSLSIKEGEVYNRKDITQRISIKTTKRYTMKDITQFDNRITRLEYYVVLNALEQQAKDMVIPSASNPALNRFKNGIFADPFNSFNASNVTDFEYKASIDPQATVLRPFFKTYPVDYKYISANSTTSRVGPVVMAPYSQVQYIQQPYATKYRNATESVWQWNGNVDLYPSYDFYRDDKQASNVNVNIDTTTPWTQMASSPFGTVYGNWRTVDTSSVSNTTQSGAATVTSTITTTTQQQTVTSIAVDSVTQSYNFGNYVSDVSISPYIRSKVVAFVANNLKPNTTMHIFFDGVNVDNYCAPGVLSGITNPSSGQENTVVTQNGNYGATLVSSSDGTLFGLFKIPENTFRTGDRTLRIVNVNDLTQGANAIITSATGTYSASSLSVTKQTSTLHLTQPSILFSSNTQNQTITTSQITGINVTSPSRPAYGYGSAPLSGGGGGGRGIEQTGVFYAGDGYMTTYSDGSYTTTDADGNYVDSGSLNGQTPDPSAAVDHDSCADDPIAQSFIIMTPPDGSSGVYITQIGLYFYEKDSNANNGVTVYVSEVKNGYPDTSTIVASGRILSSNVTTSADASVETVVTLSTPFLATAGQQYAFIVKPDGNSPEWTLWTAEVGGIDVSTGSSVFSSPYAGVLFVSSNFTTWTALQKEDLKFNVYRANFATGDFYAYFDNDDSEYITTSGFTRANSAVAIEIGDLVYTSNSTFGPNTASNAAFGVVHYVDEASGVVYLDSSTNGKFFAANNINVYRTPSKANTAYITNTYLIATSTISSVDNLQYEAVVPKFGTIQPILSNISYEFKGTNSSYVKDTTYQKVTGETEYEYLDNSRYLVSKSNEITSMASVKSNTFRIKLSNSSTFTSPALSLKRKSSVMVHNIINNDNTNEYTRYGNATTKYISKQVVLADGMESEDLRFAMTAYRPVNTDVDVYVKFWNPSDPEVFNSKNWTKLNYLNNSNLTYSSPTDRTDFVEYDLGIGSSPVNTNDAYLDQSNNGFLTYVNAGGSKLVTFKVFAVKIVLRSSNPARIPLINDIRAIALQV